MITDPVFITAGVIACFLVLAAMWIAVWKEKRRRAKWEFDKDGIPF